MLEDRELRGRRVLLVEDEAEIAEILDAFFAREGSERLIARDGEDALKAVAFWRPDLIILDVRLPKRDGLSVLAELRGRGGPPVIIVSALGEDIDKLSGFRLGCDDYVVKPFNPLEVLARAKAVLRRPTAEATGRTITLGALRIDLEAHAAFLNGEPLALTPTEYKLLVALAERPGQLLSRAQLVEAALGDDAFDRSVNPHISRLRQKLDECGGVALVAVRGEGYRLEARP